MLDTHISLAHGNGGRYMRELVERLFQRHLGGPELDVQSDAVGMPGLEGEVMVTTDGFSVQPLEFPGGNIGSLAVHGTVNDLAVAGARPRYLTLNAFIEEGFELAHLERIVCSLGEAAREAGVRVVAGDTKVLPRGQVGGLYLATTGIGLRDPRHCLGLDNIREGDRLLLSGPVGNHGTAVMLAREQFGLQGELYSDAACVLPLTQALLPFRTLRFMRDPTRGGLATVAHEIAHATGCTLRLQQPNIPVEDPVSAVCEMLGYDPLYLACEGRVVAIVGPDEAEAALTVWRALPNGGRAAIIGEIEVGSPQVILQTALGGERFVEELEDEPLPRIC
jgi:hydrogenase expression/formation protein HypE